ncbi:MAG: hypothetical protein JXB24_01640 [Bacteroidales bacterium]|jgi:hypothetical protein|nr:hypothetical protein [Bacteroidales bacterium]
MITCSTDEDTIPECKMLFYFSDTSERAEEGTLKGEIMFSWREGGIWYYSIIPNLNVRSASEVVSKNNAMAGEECLKKNLILLPLGEEVFWEGIGEITSTEGQKIKLEFPPPFILDDLVQYCEEINVKLVIPK